MSSKQTFSERLRKCRATRDLTQGQLAERAGLPAASISHFEAGGRFPSGESLRKLADALNTSVDYLLGRVELPDAVDSGQSGPQVNAIFRNLEGMSGDALEEVERLTELLANIDKKRRARDDSEER